MRNVSGYSNSSYTTYYPSVSSSHPTKTAPPEINNQKADPSNDRTVEKGPNNNLSSSDRYQQAASHSTHHAYPPQQTPHSGFRKDGHGSRSRAFQNNDMEPKRPPRNVNSKTLPQSNNATQSTLPQTPSGNQVTKKIDPSLTLINKEASLSPPPAQLRSSIGSNHSNQSRANQPLPFSKQVPVNSQLISPSLEAQRPSPLMYKGVPTRTPLAQLPSSIGSNHANQSSATQPLPFSKRIPSNLVNSQLSPSFEAQQPSPATYKEAPTRTPPTQPQPPLVIGPNNAAQSTPPQTLSGNLFPKIDSPLNKEAALSPPPTQLQSPPMSGPNHAAQSSVTQPPLSYIERTRRTLANSQLSPSLEPQKLSPLMYKGIPTRTPPAQLQSPPLIGSNHSTQSNITSPLSLSNQVSSNLVSSQLNPSLEAQKLSSLIQEAPTRTPSVQLQSPPLIGSNHSALSSAVQPVLVSKQVPSNLVNSQLSHPLEVRKSSENQNPILNVKDALSDLYLNNAKRFFQNVITDIQNPEIKRFVHAAVEAAVTAFREGRCTLQQIPHKVREQLTFELNELNQEITNLQSEILTIKKEKENITRDLKYAKNERQKLSIFKKAEAKQTEIEQNNKKITKFKLKSQEFIKLLNILNEFKNEQDKHKIYINHQKRIANHSQSKIKNKPIQHNNFIDSTSDSLVSTNTPPEIRQDGFDVILDREKHTIPLEQYLQVRVPEFVRDAIRAIGKVVIFVGPDEQFSNFCENCNYEIPVELNAKSSSQYLIAQNKKSKALESILVCGVGSKARLLHTILQLRYAGVESSQITVMGNIELNMSQATSNMADKLNTFLKSSQIDLLFMGGRAQVMFALCKKVCNFDPNNFPRKARFEEAGRLLQKHGVKMQFLREGTIEAACFRVANKVIVAFRMPNGELAGLVTRALLARKVRYMVMLGAGGSLREDVKIGVYQTFSEAKLEGYDQMINTANLNIFPFPFSLPKNFEIIKGMATVTVPSPLIETLLWLVNSKAKGFDSVDAEYYYILRALLGNFFTKLLEPGLFVSDTPNNPLAQKIGHEAYQYSSFLIENLIEWILGEDVVLSKEEEKKKG